MPLFYTNKPTHFGLPSKMEFYNPVIILVSLVGQIFLEDILNLDKTLEMSEINRKLISFVFFMILLFIPSRMKLPFCL